MIERIHLCFRHERRVARFDHVAFKPRYNVVIGPNGSGKTTLLEAVARCRECRRDDEGSTRYRYFNSETMNPHRSHRHFRGIEGSVIRVRAMFSSHGETMRDVLRFMPLNPGDCFVLDEPESGHDLQWIIKIRKGLDQLVRKSCQVIVASHHPVFWDKANVIELRKNYLTQARRLQRRCCCPT